MIFTMTLYLVIGPFFALPRLATTSFEIGIAPFLSTESKPLALVMFSILFFASAWWFSRKPTQLLSYVGKFLNPLFLLLLGILLIMAFINPLGSISNAAAQGNYLRQPFITGFTEGYNTLDALASLAFGIIIITTIKSMGVKKPSTIALATVKSGFISILLMGIIYTLLGLIGAMSLGHFAMTDNGGIALAQIAKHYLGTFGSFFLSLIVIIACLKTAIGLVTACSETFAELFPKQNYAQFIAVISFLPCIFANVGLTKIISISTPVLMFIYPLAITLILLALISPLFKQQAKVYQMTTYFTLIAAVLDGVNALPESLKNSSGIKSLLNFANQYLPFFSIGMGWLTPAACGFIMGILWWQLSKRRSQC
ncbi:MAG: branched-chain amino acid transport system II carrier protein, partial [Streptococcaceae bacterium]|jgi:LIVCS family branched-chain amino acid:cation transporter|nr:branched-chain amino acid transport system II carrier protein [Streptococcaceae bacterium]